MEEYLVNTGKKPCTVKFQIDTDGSQVPVYVIGYDLINTNTLYFRSRFLLSGPEEITMNCPQSPRMLKIAVWSEGDIPLKSVSVSVLPLDVPKATDPVIIFIERFSRIAGRLRPGNYTAKGVPFTVQLRRNIYNDAGKVHNTPARIHEELPLIQVSQAKFNQTTVPGRVIIILHEVAHNFINSNPDSETESDQNGRNIYRQLGYPEIEAVNAFADIMPDTDENYMRMINLVNT